MNVTIPSDAVSIQIVVENMGRINYGSMINDSKAFSLVSPWMANQ